MNLPEDVIIDLVINLKTFKDRREFCKSNKRVREICIRNKNYIYNTLKRRVEKMVKKEYPESNGDLNYKYIAMSISEYDEYDEYDEDNILEYEYDNVLTKSIKDKKINLILELIPFVNINVQTVLPFGISMIDLVNMHLDNPDKDKVIIELIERGAEVVNYRGNHNLTYLMNKNNSLYLTKKLLELEIDVNAKDNNGQTALFYTRKPTIVKELVKYGIDVNVKDNDGKTALFYARKLTIVKELLKSGIDVNVKDNDSQTALFYTRKPTIVKELVKYGIDVNAKDNKGKTALYYAEDSNIIKELLKSGIDVNAKDKYGETALHYVEDLNVIKSNKV
jgi:hypothetical protein